MRLRRIAGAAAGLAVLTLAAEPAAAVLPVVTIQAPALSGAAPFRALLTASGDPAVYSWDLGDGARADGPTVDHTYERVGRYTVTVTATSASGETSQARAVVTAMSLALRVRQLVRFDRRVTFSGTSAPRPAGRQILTLRRDGALVATARTRPNGTFRFVRKGVLPGVYQVTVGDVPSNAAPVSVRPLLQVTVRGNRTVGRSLTVLARLRPRAAGQLRVRVFRRGVEVLRKTFAAGAWLPLDTRRAGRYELRFTGVAAPGFATASRRVRLGLHLPALAQGNRGASVRVLEERLAELKHAIKGVDGSFGYDTLEAVLAAQKLHGLPRTGRVDARLWNVLQRAKTPRPRVFGSASHIEVDKGRQLLFEVHGRRVTRVVHVSTGATGNTPLGRWRVYRKVPGWDWVLWYPMYFLRGFAIHGYPSVPVYPASHGCVRVPMWLAPGLYSRYGYGSTVYVY